MVVPLAAVLFNLISTIIHYLRHKTPLLSPQIRDAALRGAQYAATIGILEVVGRFEPALRSWAQGAMYVLALAEIGSGIATSGIALKPPPKL